MNNRIKILFSGSISPDLVLVKEAVSSRKIDDILENFSKNKWRELVEESKKNQAVLWDSYIYRFENLFFEKGILNIEASTIPFAVRLGMNYFSNRIESLGEDYNPRGMFFSCLIRTSDDFLVFIKKSNKFFSSKKYAFVGGVLSKTEINLSQEKSILKPIQKEILEELGSKFIYQYISLKHIYINETFNCCLLFDTQSKQTKKEMQDIFSSSDGEIESLVFLPINNLKDSETLLSPSDLFKLKIMKIL